MKIRKAQFQKLRLFKHLNKSILMLVSGIMVIFIAGLLILTFVINKKSGLITSTNVCMQKKNMPLLIKAANAITSHNDTQLNSVALKIQMLSGYKVDPNCDYVLFMNAVSSGNISSAKNYLSLVMNDYPKNGFYVGFGKLSKQSMQAELNNETKIVNAINSAYGTISEPKQ